MSDSFEQRLLAATRVQQQGRLDEAARLYRELRRERPRDARLLYYEGVLGIQSILDLKK